jgi:hypothetical protein
MVLLINLMLHRAIAGGTSLDENLGAIERISI